MFYSLLKTFLLFLIVIFSSCSDKHLNEDLDEDLSDNVVLHYRWIHFHGRDAEGEMNSIKSIEGDTIVLPLSKFVNDGFSFVGWTTDETSKQVEFADGASVVIKNSDLNLYACWEENVKEVCFHPNGGEGEMPLLKGAPGTSIELPPNAFTKKGFHFIGWGEASTTDRIKYRDKDKYVFGDEDKLLYAIWQENKSVFKLSFHSNNGEGEIEPVYLSEGASVILPDPSEVIRRYNYTAHSWGVDPAGIKSFPFGYNFTMGSRDTTLYVVWRIIDNNIGGNSEEFKGTTQWVRGVKPPENKDWKALIADKNDSTVVWKPGVGWFDTDQFDHNMCWAATACNLLHWWLEQNKENLEKIDYKGPRKYNHSRDSEIYRYFLKNFGNHGNQTQYGFTWFIYGQDEKNGGAFFKDVFKGKGGLVESHTGTIKKRSFNEYITAAIKESDGIGIIYSNEFMHHQVTVWGARYNADGFIDRLYYTQSNDYDFNIAVSGERAGLLYMDILYDSGYACTESSVPGRYLYIKSLQTYSLGTEMWNSYNGKFKY